MANKIRIELIPEAFQHALLGEYSHEIDLTPVTGMSVDAAFMVLRRTELFRDTYGRGWGSELRQNVTRAGRASGLAYPRAHAYEVVAMNYYGIIKRFQEEGRQARRENVKLTANPA